MKRRLIISLILSLLDVALVLFSAFYFKGGQTQVTFLMISGVLMLYIGVYVFGGLAKLIIYSIYGLLIFILMYLFQSYRVGISIFGTALLIINPLLVFEQFLEKKITAEEVLPLNINISGSYWPFFAYRAEMKNQFHLDSTTRLYKQRWYLYLRQLTAIVLLALGFFLLITQLNNLAISPKFKLDNFVILYSVAVVFILTMLIFKKGFKPAARTLTVLVFPPIIVLIAITQFQSPITKPLFIAFIVVLGVGIIIQQINSYFKRVVYTSYDYFDVEKRVNVYANEIFEPLVYNETFTKISINKFKVDKTVFDDEFKKLIEYANFFGFIISAYSISQRNEVAIYSDYHSKSKNRPMKFKTFLETTYKTEVRSEVFDDPDKKFYEKNFFHNPEYIVARAQKLASLAKTLENKTQVIISIFFTFTDKVDLSNFHNIHPVNRLKSLEESYYYAVRLDIKILNVDYLIENMIRDVLLDALIYRGQYVRIQVYY